MSANGPEGSRKGRTSSSRIGRFSPKDATLLAMIAENRNMTLAQLRMIISHIDSARAKKLAQELWIDKKSKAKRLPVGASGYESWLSGNILRLARRRAFRL